MTSFMENMEFFQEKAIAVHDCITREEPLFPFQIEPTQDSKHNYVLENDTARCFVHSIYDIQREMDSMFKDIESDTEVMILFGFGCGYAFPYIKEAFPKIEHVIVIEPILQLFKNVLEKVSIKSMIGSVKQMTLILNKDIEESVKIVTQTIVKEHNKKIDIAYHLSYRSLLKGYFEVFNTSFIKYLQVSRRGISNREIMKKNWPANLFQNLRIESLPVESLFTVFKKTSLVLLTGGESLREKIDSIGQLKEKALVIALGDAIDLLHEEGIRPHFQFCLHIDPASNLFDYSKEDQVPLIYSDHIPSQVLSTYWGHKFRLVLESDVLTQYIYTEAGLPFTPVREGPSPLNSLVDLLCKSGIKEILLLDLDLSLRENESEKEEKPIRVKDRDGEDLLTTGYLLQVKRVLERQIVEYEDVQFIVDGESRMEIQHAIEKPFVEILREFEGTPSSLFSLPKIFERVDERVSLYQESIEKGQKSIEEDLESILSCNKRWAKDLKRLSRYRERNLGVMRLIKEYKYLESHWEKLKENEFYSKVMMKMLGETFMAILSATNYRGEDKRRQIEALERRQTGLVAETNAYVEYLESLFEDLREEEELDFEF